MNLLWGLILFLAIIIIHEAGHAIAARAYGVGLLKFSIGFGPGIVLFRTKNFPVMLSLIPLGGYTFTKTRVPAEELQKIRSRIKDAAPDSKEAETLKKLAADFEEATKIQQNIPGEYLENIPYWQKMVFFSAGIIANLISAAIALSLIYIFAPGAQVTILGHSVMIGYPEGGWPGALVNAVLDTATTFWRFIQNIYRVIPEVLKETFKIIITHTPTPHRGMIGSLEESAKAVGSGWTNALYFFYFVSLIIAAFNLLPLGILDGGRMFLQTIKKIINNGKIVKIAEIALLVFGFILLLSILLNNMSSDLYDIYNWLK